MVMNYSDTRNNSVSYSHLITKLALTGSIETKIGKLYHNGAEYSFENVSRGFLYKKHYRFTVDGVCEFKEKKIYSGLSFKQIGSYKIKFNFFIVIVGCYKFLSQ